MKKRMIGLVAIIVGALLIAVSLLVPLVIMARATSQEPIAIIGGAEKGASSIGIIGGADGPTNIYLYSSVYGGIWLALTALGALAVVSGTIVWIADRVARKI